MKDTDTKVYTVTLTHIEVHATVARKQNTLFRQAILSIKKKEAGNAHFPLGRAAPIFMTLPIATQAEIEHARQAGMEIRFDIPESLPIIPGKDVIQFLQAREREKRVSST